MTRINSELQEVHKIMVQNIEDVLQRGDALTCKYLNNESYFFYLLFKIKCSFFLIILALDNKAQNLRTLSDKYKKNANKLNMQSTYARIGAIVALIIILLLVLKFYLF